MMAPGRIRGLLTVVFVAAFTVLPACSVGESVPLDGESGALDTTARPDRLLRSESGAWELRIWYRAKGTRNEGQHGVLTFEGQEVSPRLAGEERDTELGRMKYYGPLGDRRPWAPTGWNFFDPSRMMPSSWVEPRPAGTRGVEAR